MKTLSYSIASLLVLFTLTTPADLSAQGPTVASSFSIENPVGERVTLDIPNSGVLPYTLLFPASAPTPGSLFYGTAGTGTTDWLAAGPVGTVLQIGVNGDPEWSAINILPGGSTLNSTLIWNGTNWVENTNVTMTPGGAVTMAGDLTVNGANVNLPAGSVDNTELANSSVTVTAGTGLSGGGNVALGGTITLNNDGILSVSGIGTGIDVQTVAGAVTVENTGVTGLTAGGGISLSGSTGNVTVTNAGILDVLGTTNQVNVSKVAGVATLSTPQNIHTGAAPTFAGMTLTGLTSSVDPYQVVVRNTTDNSLETRSINVLPNGTGTNTTLIWNGTNWVENTNVTMTPGGAVTMAGDLTVNGANVNLPAGSVDNTELANDDINLSYGTGLSGDASVVLGGTLNIQNNGVTGLTAGTGISLSGSTGNVTVTNGGILSVVGTTNQVNVSTVAGVATLSTPQNIHTDATPTFDGLTLDNLSSGSTATEVVVSNGGSLQTRSLSSLTGSGGRVSTSSATSGGGWSMTISDGAVTSGGPILVTYEDPAGGPDHTVHIVNRTNGSSFEVQFSGKPATGSFVNYYILP